MSTKLEITRQIKFCAGHRLMNHGGKCENLHGHNYLAEITVSGSKTDDVGRVVDFSVIKSLFKGWLDEHWDHGFLLFERDHDAIAAIRNLNSKIYLMPSNPTAENMAAYLHGTIGPMLLETLNDSNLKVTRVAIWENDESYAEIRSAETHPQTDWLESTVADAR